MIINKTNLIVFLVGVFLGLATGFFTGKAIYDTPIDTKIERDTVVVTDTVKYYLPTPKDSIRTKYITRYLPVHDTAYQFREVTKMIHDTVAVQLPIMSKHYGDSTYDAWVSGFEPSLDSIKVYRKMQYVTTTIIKEKQRSPYSLDVNAGANYNIHNQTLAPYVLGDFQYNINKSRFSFGFRGGVYYKEQEKVNPFVDGYLKIKVF